MTIVDELLGARPDNSAFGPGGPWQDDLYKCVHCGLCLNACPTYRALGLETDSPRGRIYLMRAAYEGRIPLSDPFALHIDLCLDCRGCETACPSGVPYGRLLEAARGGIHEQRPGSPLARAVKWLVFHQLFPYPSRLRLVATGLKLYQRSGLQQGVRRSGVLKLLPEPLPAWEQMAPPIAGDFFDLPESEVVPARGETRQRVGFINGCIMPLALGPSNAATVRVLARNGCEVVLPRAQRCCGALHVHSGDREMARRLARRNIAAFERAKVEVILINAAGCGSVLKEYGELLAEDPRWAGRAAAFAAKVRDVSEWLADNLVDRDFGPLPLRVVYQDACHLAHAQKVRAQPRALLRSIPELELVEMADPDQCCGGAGIYNLVHPELSQQILAPKLANIRATGAEVVVTGNPGCLLQIRAGLEAQGVPTRIRHLMDLLDAAYRAGSAANLPPPASIAERFPTPTPPDGPV